MGKGSRLGMFAPRPKEIEEGKSAEHCAHPERREAVFSEYGFPADVCSMPFQSIEYGNPSGNVVKQNYFRAT